MKNRGQDTHISVKILSAFTLMATLFLLFIVAFNIIARQIHDASSGSLSFMIPGVIELSKYTLLLIVFSALPRSVINGMVQVDLLTNSFPTTINQFLNKLWLTLMASFMGLLTWLFINKALVTFSRGDATQDLQIPLFYFYAFISFTCLITLVSCLQQIIQNNKNRAVY